MSDVINSIFGRPKNETAGSGGYAYGTVEPEPGTEAAAVVEETDSAPETETAAETAEDAAVDSDHDDAEDTAEAGEEVTGTDEEAVAEDTGEDDTDANAVEDTEEDDTDPNAAEDAAETAAETETEAAAETEPVAEAVEAEPVADTEPAAAEAEAAPVVAEPAAETEAAAARPAAGSRGSTTIADGVVGKIVVRIAAQTEGVHSVAEDGIKVELADEVAWVTIPVVVEFGHAVKALGEQIRVAVIDAVEQYLGLDVEVVDVHVTDIHFPEAD
ncbi:Asp23/Gls24 family envelope stress response protein [Amycolatopsis kentuckyensis]|uniref:Asp23/Gls24 family envelope stress response protein n=1 Tax=Amycolatopsis kentuckyensis TaxID=218823 RepID=UPI000A3B75CA|nr:Asp23/Gls24 family envelope stress response protein [Amycolatopsis kentuckyensis]